MPWTGGKVTEREICCERMGEILKWWPAPFWFPTYIDPDDHEMHSDRLAVSIYQYTPSGRISTAKSSVAYLHYCPFCGKDLSVPKNVITVNKDAQKWT